MRAAVASARRGPMLRSVTAAWTSHSTGPSPASTRLVALTLPTVTTVSANSAGWRQPPVRAARTVSPIIQPSPAHGSSTAEMRAE